jgi:hypothetical protein
MKSSKIYLIVIVLVILGAVVFVKCNDAGKTSSKTDSTTSPMGPAPDNNSANNPSSADSNYSPGNQADTLGGKK